MLKKDRYRLVYRIVKNEFQDTQLAKKAQTWKDDTLLERLGIRVDEYRKEPELNRIKTKRQRSYYDRKRNRFEYGIEQGLTAEQSLKVSNQTEENIRLQSEYFEVKTRQRTSARKKLEKLHERMDLWSEWSQTGMPPEIRRLANKINKSVKTPKGAPKFDVNAKYGYVYAYYMFVEERNEEDIKDLVKPNIHDEYMIYYPKEVRAVGSA